MLLERRRKRRERGLKLGAKTRDHGNDRYRDARCNQAVLDRRCGVFVLQESDDQAHECGLSKIAGRLARSALSLRANYARIWMQLNPDLTDSTPGYLIQRPLPQRMFDLNDQRASALSTNTMNTRFNPKNVEGKLSHSSHEEDPGTKCSKSIPA